MRARENPIWQGTVTGAGGWQDQLLRSCVDFPLIPFCSEISITQKRSLRPDPLTSKGAGFKCHLSPPSGDTDLALSILLGSVLGARQVWALLDTRSEECPLEASPSFPPSVIRGDNSFMQLSQKTDIFDFFSRINS